MAIWRQPPQPQQITVHTPIIIVGGEVYELSCTDGIKAGDATTGSLTLNLSLTDGLKGSELLVTQCSFGVSCTDGLKGGDNSAGAGVFSKVVSDGLKVGDTCGAGFVFQLLASDGVKLSDTLRRLVGSADVSEDSSIPTNTFHLSKFIALSTAAIRQIRINSVGSINIKLALYADSAGEPGALLNAMNDSVALVAGWNTITFPTTSIVIGTDYWLAFNSG